ncbi:MAG TPA: helix-turn-helix transcriptional regulator [Solirubrobacteraceae bacterium]|nr:helix-turn-helix transcriptional regulator [Solirubrobacteraceae bacterium]
MRSQVNWAVLGLVIERPSYGYELYQRFERVYRGVLSVSSFSHVYTALNVLEARSMIERIPGKHSVEPGVDRQPKPHYRATDGGLQSYQEWLIAEMCEDRRRSQLFVRELSVFVQQPEVVLHILERFEHAVLEQAPKAPISTSLGVDSGLIARLAAEESRLSTEAKLAWIQYARQVFAALAESRAATR